MLTEKGHQVMTFIVAYRDAHGGLVPTFQEIGDHQGISKSNVSRHIDVLVARGFLRKGKSNHPRTLQVLRQPDGMIEGYAEKYIRLAIAELSARTKRENAGPMYVQGVMQAKWSLERAMEYLGEKP